MVIRHLEVTKKTGASPVLGRKLLSKSSNIFLLSVFTPLYVPHRPPFVVDEEAWKVLWNNVELSERKEDVRKKGENLYTVMSSA